MNRFHRLLGCGACVLFMSLGSLAEPANAESISFRGSGHAAAVGITLLNGSTTLMSGNVMAGELNWSWLGGVPGGLPADLYTYCIDATQYLLATQIVNVQSTSGFTTGSANAGAKVSWLVNTYADAIRTGGTNAQGAALQVAIWEALYDTSGSFDQGSFRMSTSGAIRTQAEAYLTALYGSNYLGSTATWLDVNGPNAGQDQLTRSVPEPTTLLLMGAAGLFLARRRRVTAR
jgi:hypothetical protein